MDRKVAVTGIGLVTPLGTGVDKTWSSLCAGKSGISRISRFDCSDFKTTIAGEVNDFHAGDFLPRKEANKTELFIAFAVASSRMAIENSGLAIENRLADRIGVVTGCGLGGLTTLETNHDILKKKGPGRVSPFLVPMMIGNMAAGMISIHLGAKGPNSNIATACAAGAHAIGESYRMIQQGDADAMITGGVDSLITPLCIAGFNSMKALSTRNHEPEKASRPFDRDRDGFVVGEGCGMLILESLDKALERGATIFAEVCGFGMSGDGYHMTAPSPDGEGAARCMTAALEHAGLSYDEIDYINAHGTSTPMNDLIETRAMKRVFKHKAASIPISATKSMTGHLLGGAGGIEAAFTVLAIHNGIVPPTINLDNPDDECDLDYVPHTSRRHPIRYAMTNSFGFGGTNASLIFKK